MLNIPVQLIERVLKKCSNIDLFERMFECNLFEHVLEHAYKVKSNARTTTILTSSANPSSAIPVPGFPVKENILLSSYNFLTSGCIDLSIHKNLTVKVV